MSEQKKPDPQNPTGQQRPPVTPRPGESASEAAARQQRERGHEHPPSDDKDDRDR